MASWAPSLVTPDPRPARRVKASPSEWDTLHARFEGACCVHCGLPHQSLHHIVPRSQGGDDVPLNLAPLCGDGTRGCHGLLETHAAGWERVAVSVRQYVLGSRERGVYVIGKIGWDRFNGRYPLSESKPGGRSPGSAERVGFDSESEWGRYEEPVWRTRPPEDDPRNSGRIFESDAVEGWSR